MVKNAYRYLLPVLMAASLCLSSCGYLMNPFWGGGGDDDDDGDVNERKIEQTFKFSLATGGVAPGRDELVLFESSGMVMDLSSRQFNCLTDKDILHFEPRPGNDTYSGGSGVLIVPTASGIATVTCLLDGVPLSDTYQVTIAPQNLIQILVAEAGAQLAGEAELDGASVKLISSSSTGNAIASVIRNRIKLIEEENDPSLFNADETEFEADPDVSYYDAVITAPNQFSPVNPLDVNYETYKDAEDRNFLADEVRTAYDQAVLTAAYVYNDEIEDPTGGAFAFRSPTTNEWTNISEWLATGATTLPPDSGVTDANYPAFAPVQIVVLKSVWTYDDGRPAFIFIRERAASSPAVTDLP